MSGYVWVEHIAGPMRESVQKCTRCGEVLIDGRGAVSSDGRGPRAFQPGVIYRTDGCLTKGRPDGDVVQCGGQA